MHPAGVHVCSFFSWTGGCIAPGRGARVLVLQLDRRVHAPSGGAAHVPPDDGPHAALHRQAHAPACTA